MRLFALFSALLALAGCTWETYQDQSGHTGLRPKYEAGTRVYYEDGTYSRNQLNNQFRPEQHAVKPAQSGNANVRGTTWQQQDSTR